MAAYLTERDLYLINRDGNASSPYESEDAENWLPEASYTGKDCDSYASWKKREILRRDWAMNERMAIATCWTETREYHAVLLVHLDSQVWMLDNRFSWVEPIRVAQRIGYNFHKVPRYMQNLINVSKDAS